MIYPQINAPSARRTLNMATRILLALQLDGPLLVGLGLVAIFGLIVLYSASGQNSDMILRTLLRMALGGAAMVALAQLRPNTLRTAAPWLYALGIVLLLVVDATGYIGKGAQRWLNLGIVRFQPSEIMKLAVPLLCAWYLQDRPLPLGLQWAAAPCHRGRWPRPTRAGTYACSAGGARADARCGWRVHGWCDGLPPAQPLSNHKRAALRWLDAL